MPDLLVIRTGDLTLNRLGSGKRVFQSLISSTIFFTMGLTIYYQTVKTLN